MVRNRGLSALSLRRLCRINTDTMRAHEFTLQEGADFYGYYKDAEKGVYSYPKGMDFKIGHVSNVTARSILSSLRLDPDFENTSPYPIDDFLKTTQSYLNANAADKDSVEYDNVEAVHIEASRFKKQYPEITHVGFN